MPFRKLAVAVLCVAALAGCSSVSTGNKTVVPFLKSITISPMTATVQVGQVQPYTAQGYDQNGNLFNANYTWASQGQAMLRGSSLQALAVGTATITASANGVTSPAATLTITAAPALQSINLSVNPASIQVGGTAQLSYTAVDQYGNPFTASSLTYNVTGTAATLNSGSGTLTGVSAGSVTVTATSGSVTSNPVSVSVGLDSQTVTFPAPASQAALTSETLSATASSGLPITYSVSTGSVCSVSGNVVSLLTAGTCTLTATQPGNTQYGAASQTVSFAVTLAAQTITFAALSGQQVGATFTVNATASSGLAVALTSLTPSICSPTSAIAVGTCTIQATQPGNNVYAAATSVSQSFTVSPVPPALKSITLSAGNTSLNVNDTTTLTATGYDQYGNVFAITPTFNVTGTAITISGITVTGAAAGSASVTASSGAVTSNSVSFTVSLIPQTITFPAPTPGTTFTLSATASSNLPVTYSTNSTACTVSGNTVTEVSAGDCLILADQAGNSVYAAAPEVSQDVTIGQTVSFVSVSPSSATLSPGATQQFTATAYDQFNQPMQTTPTFTWAAASGAGIDQTGLYTAINTGDTTLTDTVTASVGSVTSNTAAITLNPAAPILTVVTLAPQNATINAPNGTANFTITAADQFNRPYTPLPGCTYQSSNPSAATIGANGQAVATNTGTVAATTTITAICGSFTETTNLTVNPPPFVKTLSASPVTVGIYKATTTTLTATDEYGNPFSILAGQTTVTSFDPTYVSVVVSTTPGTLNIGGVAATPTTTPVTVSVGGVSTTFNVTVTPCASGQVGNPTFGCYTPVLTTITVTPETTSMEFNGTQTVTASALDQNGAAFTGATFTWQSDNTSFLTVDASGNVTAVGVGATTITASADNVTGTSATITVSPAPYPSTPVIASLFPPMAVAKDYTNSTQQGILPHSTAVVVNGSGFLPGAVVCFGSDCGNYTTYKSSTKLVMLVPWQDLTTAGAVSVTVKNPALTGYTAPITSAASTFTLTTKGFVTITFDDGYASGLKGTALFNAQGLPTTQFIITGNTCATIGTCASDGLRADGYPWGWNGVGPATGCQYSSFPLPVSASEITECSVGVGFPAYIQWSDVAQLASPCPATNTDKVCGNEIAPHTRSHNQLSLELPADVTGELQGALADLQWHAAPGHDTAAGYKITSVFAFPYGDYGCYASEVPPVGTFNTCVTGQFNDQQLGTQVKQAGYRGARTSDAALEGGLKYEEGAPNSPLPDDCSNDSCYGRADQPLFMQTITADQTAGDTCSFAGGTSCDTSASNGAAPCMENGVAVAKPGFKCWVDNAVQTGQWVILLFHRVDDNTADDKSLSVNSTEINKLAQYLKSQGITTVTFRQGLAMEGIDGQYEPVDSNGNIIAYPDPVD